MKSYLAHVHMSALTPLAVPPAIARKAADRGVHNHGRDTIGNAVSR